MLSLRDIATALGPGDFMDRVSVAARIAADAVDNPDREWGESASGERLAKEVLQGSAAAIDKIAFAVLTGANLPSGGGLESLNDDVILLTLVHDLMGGM